MTKVKARLIILIMFLEKVLYFLNQCRLNLKINPVISGASTVIIALSLFIFAMFLTIYLNFQKVSDRWGRKVRVDVYLVDAIDAQQVSFLENEIKNLGGVENVKYISADSALQEFRHMIGGDDELLRELETNPLPASFKVQVKKEYRNPSCLKELAEEIKKLDGVDQIRYGAEWVEKLDALLNLFRLLGSMIGGILFLSGLLIISNTIRLTIYSRKEEIEIMRLVGATENFVRIPFYLEGIVEGFTASIIALILWGLVYSTVFAKLDFSLGALGGAMLEFLPLGYSIALVVVGTLLGFLGSLTALSRIEKENL